MNSCRSRWPCGRSERRISRSPKGVHGASCMSFYLAVACLSQHLGCAFLRDILVPVPRAGAAQRGAQRPRGTSERGRRPCAPGALYADTSGLLKLRWGDPGPGQAQLTSCVPPASSVRPVCGGGDAGRRGATRRAGRGRCWGRHTLTQRLCVGPHTAGFGFE